MVKKKKERITYRYELKHHRKVVYFGITVDPRKRLNEHKKNKKFTHMRIIGPKVNRESGEKWEEKRLKSYRNGHCGKNPKYNRTDR